MFLLVVELLLLFIECKMPTGEEVCVRGRPTMLLLLLWQRLQSLLLSSTAWSRLFFVVKVE